MSVLKFYRKMSDRPPSGREITVLFEGGAELACHTTRVVSEDYDGIMIYGPDGNAIDEDRAFGWTLKVG